MARQAATARHEQRDPSLVTEKIKEFVLSKHLQPGDPLPTELELCEALGVSRTSVRDALRRLETMCVLESRPAIGTFVKEPASGALQAEIDRLAKDLSDDRQWQLQGTLPGLSLRQINNPQTGEPGQRSPANAFLAYEKAEPDKKNEAIPKGLARARAVRE